MSYLLIGLGNPGEKYKQTRHNVGKLFAGWLKEKGTRLASSGQVRKKEEGKLEIAETESFMNASGAWIKNKMAKMVTMVEMAKNSNHSSPSDHFDHLIIIHDDLDIPLGKFKIQFGKGPRLHNGVLSVEQALGTKEFWRIRIGIDAREEGRGKKEEGEDYVLEQFTPEEKKILESVFPEIKDRLLEDFRGT